MISDTVWSTEDFVLGEEPLCNCDVSTVTAILVCTCVRACVRRARAYMCVSTPAGFRTVLFSWVQWLIGEGGCVEYWGRGCVEYWGRGCVEYWGRRVCRVLGKGGVWIIGEGGCVEYWGRGCVDYWGRG